MRDPKTGPPVTSSCACLTLVLLFSLRTGLNCFLKSGRAGESAGVEELSLSGCRALRGSVMRQVCTKCPALKVLDLNPNA